MNPAPVISVPSENGRLTFWCPGCQSYHGVWTGEANPVTHARWTWNGDRVKPTLVPSVLLAQPPRCHFFVRDGLLYFCADCDHKLAGQTIPMRPDETAA